MVQGIIISLISFLVVFLMLLMLYFVINLLKVINGGVEKNPIASYEISGQREGEQEGLEDIAVIMSAISSVLDNKKYKVNKIYLTSEDRVSWSKQRWETVYWGGGRDEKI